MTPRFISALTVMQLFIVFLGVSLTGTFLRLYSAGGAPDQAHLGQIVKKVAPALDEVRLGKDSKEKFTKDAEVKEK